MVIAACEPARPAFPAGVDEWHTRHGTRGHAELVGAIGTRELIEALGRQGLDARTNTPEEYAAMLKADAPSWAAAVKASGAKVQ
jgi:hypothetical protein